MRGVLFSGDGCSKVTDMLVRAPRIASKAHFRSRTTDSDGKADQESELSVEDLMYVLEEFINACSNTNIRVFLI